jgi:Zn-dependent protease with chaperone function
VPFVLLLGALGALVGGISGAVSGTFIGEGVLDRLDKFLTWIIPLPVKPAELLPTAAAQVGGLFGGFLGAISGALKLGWRAGIWPWQTMYDADPLLPWTIAVGNVITAFACGWLFVGLWTVFERVLWHVWGARRLSRREHAWLRPIVDEAAQRMGIGRAPELMIQDGHRPTAFAGVRHIARSRGMLRLMEHDREMIAATIAYQLTRWHNGDVIATLFARGVGLPLYLMHELAYRLVKHTPWRPLQWLFRILLWSVLATVNYVVRPFHRRSIRQCTFDADDAVRLAGYARGWRRSLLLFQEFEEGRDGWAQVMLALVPPLELRLKRLEEPGRHYHLTEDHRILAAMLGAPQSTVEVTD